jgi:2-dehydro-3-deoxygluconokinase
MITDSLISEILYKRLYGTGVIAVLVIDDANDAVPQRTIAFATAAGCLPHSIEGDFNFSSREEIESLIEGNSAGRVKR